MRSDQNKNVKVIFRKIEPNFFNKYGYINLNHRLVNTKDELVEIASIFRNPMYETFRIVYMRKNEIVGYESITSKAPRCVKIFPKSREGRITAHKCFYKIKERMKRLSADGYYLMHNHPSGNAKASKDDIRVTEVFNRRVEGFRGHLIVNNDSYAWIDVDQNGLGKAENYIEIKKRQKDWYYKIFEKKSIYDVKIKLKTDIVLLMHHIKNTKEYSSLIFCDAGGGVRMIQDMPNRFLNMKEKALAGYVKNQQALSGGSKVIFATDNEEAFKKAKVFWKNETFKDAIYYKEENDKIYTYEKVRVEGLNSNGEIQNVIEDLELAVSEDFEDYENEEKINEKEKEANESEEIKMNIDFDILGAAYCNRSLKNEEVEEIEGFKSPEKIKILYKEVGEAPKIMEIDNTLEAKQELVGGLIEVVAYDDVLLICNEEGKLENLKPNVIFDFDYIAGNCFIVGDDYEHGDFRSLTEDEIFRYSRELVNRSFIYKDDDKTPSKEKEKTRGERIRGKN